MSFIYSSFISYRRNPGNESFIKNFKAIITCEAQNATNKTRVFFDEVAIEWGNDFDEKIYRGINTSYFFIPIYHNSYLHKDNVWCAREIYHAIEVEKRLREVIAPDYCFILPIIYRGSASDLPNCIGKKNAKIIRQLETTIINKKTTQKLTEFKNDIYDIFNYNLGLINGKTINLSDLLSDIEIPNNDQIKKWIDDQKQLQRKIESENPPILKMNVQ